MANYVTQQIKRLIMCGKLAVDPAHLVRREYRYTTLRYLLEFILSNYIMAVAKQSLRRAS